MTQQVENIRKEIDWSNQAGLTKTKEQMELIEQQAFENGYLEAINEADKGQLVNQGIYSKEKVKDIVEMYKTAIQQSILNDIKGTYRLGAGSGDELRLIERIFREADEKFTGVLSRKDQKSE